MSIVLAVEETSPVAILLLAAVVGGWVIAAALLGAFGRRSGDARRRLFATWPTSPLLINAVVCVFAYFAAAVVLGAVIGLIYRGQVIDGEFSPGMLVAITCGVAVAGLISLLVGLRFFVPNGFFSVGLSGVSSGQGAAVALWLLATPAVLLVSALADWVYKAIDYQHESAHELLAALDEAGNWPTKFGVVLAAVVLAPLVEEILFRGHLQTLFRRLFTSRQTFALAAPVPVMQQEAVAPSPYTPPTVIPYAQPIHTLPPEAELPPVRTFWPSAAAVLVTSILFSLVHPVWSWPPIFVLSLILGYAYERRGNLWTCITLHALFNATQTALFLAYFR